MKLSIACVLATVLLVCTGCSAFGVFPHTINTDVTLSRDNYKIVKANVQGTSTGFWLLGFIPIVPPRYPICLEDMYAQAFPSGVEGRSIAMINVVTQESGLYLVLFSFPRLTIRADFIEFNNTP